MDESIKKICVPRGTKIICNEDMRRMHELHKKGYSYGAIARMYDISRTTVCNYLTGKTKPYTEEEKQMLRNK